MNLNMADTFQSILDTIVIAAQRILSLPSRKLFKLAVQSIWQNPNSSNNIFLAFWYDKALYIACPTPKIRHFSRDLWCLFMGISQDHHLNGGGVAVASRHFQWLDLTNKYF